MPDTSKIRAVNDRLRKLEQHAETLEDEALKELAEELKDTIRADRESMRAEMKGIEAGEAPASEGMRIVQMATLGQGLLVLTESGQIFHRLARMTAWTEWATPAPVE